jgi:membrane-associated phospholipid phosphatase
VDGMLGWGLDVIGTLQQLSPAFDLPFTLLTVLGDEVFYLLFLPFVYWCLDRRLGSRLIVLVLLSAYLNVVIKALAGQPRPVDLAPGIALISDPTTGGFPSGHTQNSVVLWGCLGAKVRRRWLWIVVGLLLALIPLSRVYLGVHFPTDVLGGYVIGAILLGLALVLVPRITPWLHSLTVTWQLALAVVVPLLLALLFATEEGITASATLMGMAMGFALEPKWVGFRPSSLWRERVLGYLAGAAVLGALWLGLRVAFVAMDSPASLRFLRYALVGLWGSLGAPWLLARVGLARRREGDRQDDSAESDRGEGTA